MGLSSFLTAVVSAVRMLLKSLRYHILVMSLYRTCAENFIVIVSLHQRCEIKQ